MSNGKIFAVVCALSFLFTEGALTQTTPRLQVNASVEYRGKQPAVSFRITNESSQAIDINESTLPWGNRYGVVLFAVSKREQQPLKASYPVSDVFFEKPVRLESKGSVSGVIALSDRFGDASANLSKDDLLVFWFYEPQDAKREKLGQYGGWLLFPKTQAK